MPNPILSIRNISLIFCLIAAPALAEGVIERACLDTGEPQSTCDCAQTAADDTLSVADQQIGVQIIADPSAFFTLAGSGAVDEAFLGRWSAFSERTETQCGLGGS